MMITNMSYHAQHKQVMIAMYKIEMKSTLCPRKLKSNKRLTIFLELKQYLKSKKKEKLKERRTMKFKCQFLKKNSRKGSNPKQLLLR